ncbi:MAG: M48 family metalloprotease [Treponema sp.]|jgi:predicted Zn-dependent protease|nr:M48 family metalloprotease [Treponema sp.]
MRKLLLAFIICLLVIPVGIFGQSIGQSVFGQSNLGQPENDEEFTMADAYYLGRAVAANILSHYKPYTAKPELTQYLNRICQTLVINSTNPASFKGFFVMILDSNEFNAFASPGGHIFVTRRLVETVTSEDMLAAVIAHELAHVMLRHSITIINDTRFESQMSSIASAAAATAARTSSQASQAANFRNSISGTIDILMTNGYSQAQEYEADIEAIMLLARAGYDPGALMEMLRVLQQSQGNQSSGLYSTHPSPQFRMGNIQALQFRENTTRQQRAQRFQNARR